MGSEAFKQFQRGSEQARHRVTCIGDGEVGGKAQGLAFLQDSICQAAGGSWPPGVSVAIPSMVVVTTEVFDAFIQRNGLRDVAEDPELTDDRIALAFQQAQLPAEFVGDLRALVASKRTPLAVRSSSLLEDAMFRPFAGVYATKLIPNNQPDADSRFRKLIEAIKLVYASTYFKDARTYRRSVGPAQAEKMAVIIQDVVGRGYGQRFYPQLCGVARSYNYYPVGHAQPSEGVVDLALGLGKTIVDGGLVWTYSPAYPRTPPPFNSVGDMLKHTQHTFWAVHLGQPPAHDPISETEHMLQLGLPEAEADENIAFLASTYDPQGDRVMSGIGPRGPRILNFAPILVDDCIPLNSCLIELLRRSEEAIGAPVEIEFAANVDPDHGIPAEIGFLQVRPMVVSSEQVDITDQRLASPLALLSSERVSGNGAVQGIRDILYVKPRHFDPIHSRAIAAEISELNDRLSQSTTPYLLIGFGRWGSSDPWLGIPVVWGQIAGARAIVEATLPNMSPDFSQGSHFFHNLSSFRVPYFSVAHNQPRGIDWNWLEAQPAAGETKFVRHVRLEAPLSIEVDGRSRQGVILHA